MLNNWVTWVIIYLISAVVFSQSFKKANRNMTNAGTLTILLELFTALFSLLFIPFFKLSISHNPHTYLILLIVIIIYAFTDRLNIEARYGLSPSTFSMLKQLSSVFLVILSFVILKEKVILTKIVGASLILIANIGLTIDKNGKFKINKYFLMSLASNILFAFGMLINVNISGEFNLGIYTIVTVLFPAILITLFGKHNIKELKEEFNLYDKKIFLLSAFTWCVMLISSVRAYQLGSVSVVAPLLTLTAIINTIYEFVFNKDKSEFIKKLIIGIIIIIGVLLIKK